MSIEHLPAPTPSRSGFRIIPATKAVFNPYNRVETIYSDAGDKWEASLAWRYLTRQQLRTLRAFLIGLKGQQGKLYLSDTSHSNEGTWSGSPVTASANQYGSTLTVTGFNTNETGVAKAGDRFTLNGRLHEVTKDANSDATGTATLYFEPEIINPTTGSEPLITTNPYSTFMLADPKQIPTFSQSAKGAENIKLKFLEVLR